MADLIAVLRDPAVAATLDGPRWTALLSVARAEALSATLAERVAGVAVPDAVAPLLAAARHAAHQAQVAALWEAEMARRALAPLGIAPILLKGTAYAAAGLEAAKGRQIGDLDILVPAERLAEVEAALLAAGWRWLKPDPYDDTYYRRWMHELPPLIHGERERMIDVHHTILPLTHRVRPDAAALLADAVMLESGLAILSLPDMMIHCAAHALADGELDGGLRNLWDMHGLIRAFEARYPAPHAYDAAMHRLHARARHHGLARPLARAMGLARVFFDPANEARRVAPWRHALLRRRLLARDDWGRATRPLTRFAFYLRSHWLRMPPLLLARHLWTKWRRGA